MQPRIETAVSKLFEARKRHIQAQGYRGADVFRMLCVDPELPAHVDEVDAAGILAVQPDTLKARRRKKMPPTYTRMLGDKIVRYDLAVLCDMLAGATSEAGAPTRGAPSATSGAEHKPDKPSFSPALDPRW
jgi:hypothetical protein